MHALYHRVRPNWPVSLARIAARVANPVMTALVACGDDGAIVGYAAANIVADGAVFTNVYVDPVHQGQGVGANLWLALGREVSNPNRLEGFVDGDDERSIAV